MDEAKVYEDSVTSPISTMGRGLERLTEQDKSPVQTALLKINITLNKLGEEMDRLSARTSSARNLVPTESTTLDDGRKEYGSALFAELSRMNTQAEHILNNLQNIIGEIEL